jgi:hypothetical protein
MTHLSKLSLSTASRRQPMTPVARKRLNLLRKLDLQIQAAEAHLKDEEFLEDIRKWVRDEDGEKQLVDTKRPIRKWWWQHHTGAWMITLRDGSKELPLSKDKRSIEIGEISNLVDTLQTVRSAVLAGELDAALEQTSASKSQKPPKAK